MVLQPRHWSRNLLNRDPIKLWYEDGLIWRMPERLIVGSDRYESLINNFPAVFNANHHWASHGWLTDQPYIGQPISKRGFPIYYYGHGGGPQLGTEPEHHLIPFVNKALYRKAADYLPPLGAAPFNGVASEIPFDHIGQRIPVETERGQMTVRPQYVRLFCYQTDNGDFAASDSTLPSVDYDNL